MTGGKSGDRGLSVRVKKKRGIKASSRRWLERQLNDPYVRRSKAEGYRSRAAYKLIEIDDRFRFLKPGARVVDLGSAPGGWAQVAAARVNAAGERAGPKGRWRQAGSAAPGSSARSSLAGYPAAPSHP